MEKWVSLNLWEGKTRLSLHQTEISWLETSLFASELLKIGLVWGSLRKDYIQWVNSDHWASIQSYLTLQKAFQRKYIIKDKMTRASKIKIKMSVGLAQVDIPDLITYLDLNNKNQRWIQIGTFRLNLVDILNLFSLGLAQFG